ncbi:MAG: cobyrinate a,c-diamide synthase, partial [Thermoplasmata archaeon]
LALIDAGFKVKSYKVGPDYIDPAFHSRITGIPCDNIDTWMMPQERIIDMVSSNSENYDISVIEGVMGLYDGISGSGDEGSTADIARILKTPVVLVMDISGMGRSAAAVAKGFQSMANGFPISGFILNRAGSEGHYAMVRDAIESETGIPVLGYIRGDHGIEIGSRHLGLVQSIEHEDMNSFYIDLKKDSKIDVKKIVEISETAVPISHRSMDAGDKGDHPVAIAVAYDEAFDFYYEENLRMMSVEGSEIKFFSPMRDEKVPEGSCGIYMGGGFPEVFALRLSENVKMMEDLRRKILGGMPVYAECGGYMYLCRNIILKDGTVSGGLGIIPADAKMTETLTMGYREIVSKGKNILMDKGDTSRGHEFHYSEINYFEDADHPFILRFRGREKEDGFVSASILASYAHIHFSSNPRIPKNFVAACRDYCNKNEK